MEVSICVNFQIPRLMGFKVGIFRISPIGPQVPEKKIFEGFVTIYGHGGHLGHVTSIMLINFHYHVPKSLHTILVKSDTVVSEKKKF